MEKKVTEVEVNDVQKRRNPSKHYVYIMTVTWQDGTSYRIYRRYSRFFDMQCKLGEMFPLEAGFLNPLDRIIPLLPGKIVFGRSQIREVALKRLAQLDEYLKALIKLPSKISECEYVLDFFDIEADDISPPKEGLQKKISTAKAKNISGPKLMEHYVAVGTYEKQEKGELELQEGDVVEVLEKTHSGWWFVQIDDHQGWVPSTYLQPEDGPSDSNTTRAKPGEEERYICTESYDPAGEDELRLEKGVIVDVVEKNLEGWWLVRYKGKEGWAPATYLMEANLLNTQIKAKQSGVQIVSNLKDISDLLNPENHEGRPRSWVDLDSDLLHQQIKKNRCLQRGGSIRPPPRQSSIKVKSPNRSNSLKKKIYETLADFEDSVGDGISFHRGEPVTVLEKSDSGWWYVEIRGKDGWAPSTYIGETDSGVAVDENIEEQKIMPTQPEVESKIYDQISSEASDDDEEWEEIDAPLVDDNNKSDDVYCKIDKISLQVSPKLPSKSSQFSPKLPSKSSQVSPKLPSKSQVSQIKSHPMDRSKLAPPPKVPQSNSPKVPQNNSPVTTVIPTESDSQSAHHVHSMAASALAGVLKSKMEKNPPPPPSKKTTLPSSHGGLTSSDHLSDSKPALLPNKNKPQLSSNTSFDKSTEAKSASKPPPPPNIAKPQLKTNNTSLEHFESETKTSVDIPKTGIANALKSRFENQQKSNTESNVPQRVKSPAGLPNTAVSSSFKSKLEQRQKVIESGHGDEVSEPLFKSKGHLPPKPAEIKQGSSHQAIKPHQFTPKPLISGKKVSSPSKHHQFTPKPLTSVYKVSSPSNPDSNPIGAWEKSSELPKDNITSSLKSKFEAGFGHAQSSSSPHGSSKPALKPVSSTTPKTFLAQKARENNSSSQKSEISSDHRHSRRDHENEEGQLPQRGSAASLRAMFESSDKKPDGMKQVPTSVPSKPKPAALKKPSLGENIGETKNINKPSLPQKSQKLSPSKQKENKINGTNINVSNIANTLKSKLDFGGSSASSIPEKMETEEIAKTSPQQSTPGPVVNENKNSNLYMTIADFISEDTDGISFKAGEEVTVMEKAEGWWWVCVGQKEGWAPETYLEPSGTRNEESPSHITYRAMCDFEGENEGEVSLTEGIYLEVVEKSDQWWFVRTETGEGWVPRNYVEQV